MGDQSFSSLIKKRRDALGLSQARLGDLVGRSASTIRNWERATSTPSERADVVALAAVLGLDERDALEQAGFDVPVEEHRPTIEQAYASLTGEIAPVQPPLPEPEPEPDPEPRALGPPQTLGPEPEAQAFEPGPAPPAWEEPAPEPQAIESEPAPPAWDEPAPEPQAIEPEPARPAWEEPEAEHETVVASEAEPEVVVEPDPQAALTPAPEPDHVFEPETPPSRPWQTAAPVAEPTPVPELPEDDPVVSAEDAAVRTATPRRDRRAAPPTVVEAATPGEPSYVEDPLERQNYRVRALVTAAVVALIVIILLWSFENATSALGDLWGDLIGSLDL